MYVCKNVSCISVVTKVSFLNNAYRYILKKNYQKNNAIMFPALFLRNGIVLALT